MTSPQAVLQSQYDDESGAERSSAMETPAEGMQIQVPYKGAVDGVLHRIRGHLQSAISYAGETSLEAARQKILSDPMSYLIPLSAASQRESYDR
jgi:IMP dehydrogenase/GMP reductase